MSEIETSLSPEVQAIRTKAMDILKVKWLHLYTFGYPTEPFPTNYSNDLNCVIIGMLHAWPLEKSYTEAELKRAISLAQETIQEDLRDESARAPKYTEEEILEILKK